MRFLFIATLLLISLESQALVCDGLSIDAQPQYIVLMDPVSFRAGEDLPKIIRSMGFVPLVIFESAESPYLKDRILSLGVKDDEVLRLAEFRLSGRLRTLSGKEIDRTNIKAVIPDTEQSVPIADLLSTALNLPSNNPTTSSSRFEKDGLYRAAAEANLGYPKSLVVPVEITMESLRQKIQQELNWDESVPEPLVLKPSVGAGSIDVYTVHSHREIESALQAISSHPSAFGKKTFKVVIQKQLTGAEYIVDTISSTHQSRKGRETTTHILVGAWRYHRESQGSKTSYRVPLIDYVEWVPVLPKGLWKYTTSLLDAVGVQFGAGHSEIFMTKEGPKVIDFGARLPGGLPQLAMMANGGIDSRKLLVESSLDPEKLFKHRANQKNLSSPKGYAEVVFLNVAPGQTKFNGHPEILLKRLRLSTISDYRIFQADSSQSPKVSTDVTNALMRVHLSGDKEAVIQDRKFLKELHRTNYFLSSK